MGREARTITVKKHAADVVVGDIVQIRTNCAFSVTAIEHKPLDVTLVMMSRRWHYRPAEFVTVVSVEVH